VLQLPHDLTALTPARRTAVGGLAGGQAAGRAGERQRGVVETPYAAALALSPACSWVAVGGSWRVRAAAAP